MNSPINEMIKPDVKDAIVEIISRQPPEEPFYMVDIEDIIEKHKNWTIKMPRVKPYYAVKCNSCPLVLELLAGLGIGFDCASKGEIDTILAMNVSPSRIIYANPCKTKSYIKHAAIVGVDLMTFDNEPELHKVALLYPSARLILRIKVDDSGAVCRFSAKFGADLDKAAHLLTVARNLGLNVVGVSFHVGSGCENAKAFTDAISNARYVFNIAQEMGFKMTILDLGGGYPGAVDAPVTFDDISATINEALEQHFPENEQINIIAEPGRYYVASSFTLATLVIAKRLENDHHNSGAMYYLNDGVYGSFNCTIFDHLVVTPVPLIKRENSEQPSNIRRDIANTILWGPTCDSMDCIRKDIILPEMEIGEWIMFPGMGAYTIAAASSFNGFQLPTLKYVITPSTYETLRKLPNWSCVANILGIDIAYKTIGELQTKNGFKLDQRCFNLIPVN